MLSMLKLNGAHLSLSNVLTVMFAFYNGLVIQIYNFLNVNKNYMK